MATQKVEDEMSTLEKELDNISEKLNKHHSKHATFFSHQICSKETLDFTKSLLDETKFILQDLHQRINCGEFNYRHLDEETYHSKLEELLQERIVKLERLLALEKQEEEEKEEKEDVQT